MGILPGMASDVHLRTAVSRWKLTNFVFIGKLATPASPTGITTAQERILRV